MPSPLVIYKWKIYSGILICDMTDNLAFVLDGHCMNIVASVRVSVMLSSYPKFTLGNGASTHAKFTQGHHRNKLQC